METAGRQLVFALAVAATLAIGSAAAAASDADATDEELLDSLFKSYLPTEFLERPVAKKEEAALKKKKEEAAAAEEGDAAGRTLETAESMLRSIQQLGDLLQAGGGGGGGGGEATCEDCTFSCPNGATPKQKAGYRPAYNGCGTAGLQVDTSSMPNLTECCNRHDLCYGTCGWAKARCESEFKSCLRQACIDMRDSGILTDASQFTSCQAIGASFHLAVEALGCDFYLDGQRAACDCGSKQKLHSRERIRQYNEEQRQKRRQQQQQQHQDPNADAVDFSEPRFDLPAVDGRDEL